MDPFRRATLAMAALRGVDAEYRAGGTGPAVPCRVLIMQEDAEDSGRPGMVAQRSVAAGHLSDTLAAAAVGGTLTIPATGKVWRLAQKARDVTGWDWRFVLGAVA